MTRPESELEQLRYPLADAAIDRPEDALARLMSSADGLGEEEAEARLAHEGANAIPRVHGPGLLRQFASQLLHFFAAMLWLAALLAFVGGLQQLGWAIIVVVLINGVFSFAQEFKAERATPPSPISCPRGQPSTERGALRKCSENSSSGATYSSFVKEIASVPTHGSSAPPDSRSTTRC